MDGDQDGWLNWREIGLPPHHVEGLTAIFVPARVGNSIGWFEQTVLPERGIPLNAPAVTYHLVRPILRSTKSSASLILSVEVRITWFFGLAKHGNQQGYGIADGIQHGLVSSDSGPYEPAAQ